MVTRWTSTQRTAFRGLFAALFLVAVLAIVLFSVGCSLPQWRVFQKKVPTESTPPPVTTEAQKQAAAFIADVTAPPVAEPAKTVEKVHEVATGLSASLGEPKKRLTAADYEKVIASLRAGLQAKDAQLERWREFGRKYGGKPIEDTGINLAGPAGLIGLVAVVAACVAFPPIGYAILRLLPLLWGYFRRTTEAIGEFAKANPDAGSKLAQTLGDRMDSAHKRLVKVRAAKNRIGNILPAKPSPA